MHWAIGLRVDAIVLLETVRLLFKIKQYVLLGKNEMVTMFGATAFGALWQPVSIGVIVGGVGFTFSVLFNMDTSRYIPFFCISVILWQFISQALSEISGIFSRPGGGYYHFEYPRLILFPITAISKFIYMLFLNLTIFLVVAIIFQLEISLLQITFAFFGLFLSISIVFFLAIIFSLIGSRYSDYQNVVTNILQLLFYVTPIMWMPKSMPHKWVYEYNPLYYLLELVRGPLLGDKPDYQIYLVGSIMFVGLFFITLFLWSIFAWRINYHSK